MDYDRPVPREETRRIAVTFGVLYLITFATSIPALWLYQPILDDPAGYVAGGGHSNRIILAAFLELLLIISNIGTAVVVYPLLKRVSEICALGYVTARVMECTFILVGILAMFGVIQVQGSVQSLATLPEAIWELLLGIYPIVWGFRLSAPILAGRRHTGASRPEGPPMVAPA